MIENTYLCLPSPIRLKFSIRILSITLSGIDICCVAGATDAGGRGVVIDDRGAGGVGESIGIAGAAGAAARVAVVALVVVVEAAEDDRGAGGVGESIGAAEAAGVAARVAVVALVVVVGAAEAVAAPPKNSTG